MLVPLLARGPFVMQLGNAMHEQENMNTFYMCGMAVCTFFVGTKCLKFDLKHMHGIAQVHLKKPLTVHLFWQEDMQWHLHPCWHPF